MDRNTFDRDKLEKRERGAEVKLPKGGQTNFNNKLDRDKSDKFDRYRLGQLDK